MEFYVGKGFQTKDIQSKILYIFMHALTSFH